MSCGCAAGRRCCARWRWPGADWSYTAAARAEDGPDAGKRIEVAQVSASFGPGRFAGRDL